MRRRLLRSGPVWPFFSSGTSVRLLVLRSCIMKLMSSSFPRFLLVCLGHLRKREVSSGQCSFCSMVVLFRFADFLPLLLHSGWYQPLGSWAWLEHTQRSACF